MLVLCVLSAVAVQQNNIDFDSMCREVHYVVLRWTPVEASLLMLAISCALQRRVKALYAEAGKVRLKSADLDLSTYEDSILQSQVIHEDD